MINTGKLLCYEFAYSSLLILRHYVNLISIFICALFLWQAYRSSMLKAFKKNVEEGAFTFIIGMH